MNDLQVLLVNALMYTLVWIYVIVKKRKFSVGLYLWTLFTFSAWGSYMFFQQPLIAKSVHNNPQHFDALLYLFIVLLLFISPFFNAVKLKKHDIFIPHFNILKWLMVLYIGWQVIMAFIDIDQMMNILNMDVGNLSDARDNMYSGTNSNIGKYPLLNRISLVFSGLNPIALGLAVFLFFCYNSHRRLIKYFLFATLFSIFMSSVIQVSRGIITSNAIYVGLILIYIRDFIDARTKKIILFYCLPFICFSAFFFLDYYNFKIWRYGRLYDV